MSNNLPALQEKANTIQALFERDAVKTQLQKAIPKNLTVDRLLRVAMTAIRTNPRLLECSQQSLLSCIMGCATLGLEPEPFLGQAYLVPYWNKKKNCREAQLIPGYRGYLTLARRSGEVQSVSAQVVYNNDYFRLQYGLEEKLEHVPAEGDRGEVKGAYVVFRYKDGSHSFDYMTKDDIDKIRTRSQSAESGPWVTDYAEMAKKTVIRRHVKVAPLSVEIAKTAVAENLAMAGESQVDFFLGTETPQPLIDTEPPSTEQFEELLKSKVVPDDGSLEKFIELTAGAQAITTERLKTIACENFENFWGAYEKWRMKNMPNQAWKCPHCEFVAQSERGLKKHITQQHEEEPKAQPTEAIEVPADDFNEEAEKAAKIKAINEGYADFIEQVKFQLNLKQYPLEELNLDMLQEVLERCKDMAGERNKF